MENKIKNLLRILSLIVFSLCLGCSKSRDLAADADRQSTSARSLLSFSDYYWYKGEKIPLTKNPGKKYILFKAADESKVNASLSKKSIKIQEKAQKLNLSKSIQNNNGKADKDLKWMIVETTDDLASTDSEILYEASFFTTSRKQDVVGLSHLFYVKLKSQVDLTYLMQLADENNVEIIGNNINVPLRYTLQCSKKSMGNALEMANKFYETNRFATSQPDLMGEFKSACVNDTYFSDQWNLNNTGQYGGTSDVDIKYCNARSVTQGSSSIIVAVIDDGVQTTHPDLNIYSSGFDTENGTTPSVLRGSHGTACAGISGAIANNNQGIAGIAPNSPIMPVSLQYGIVYPDTYTKYASGFYYAANNGASILSNSWSGPEIYNEDLDDAIAYCLTSGRGGLGCIVVFASGNDNSSINYPANSNPDIIVVGAASPCGQRKNPLSCDTENWGSNYGTELDVVAPGVLIPTTDVTGASDYNPYYPIHTIVGGSILSSDYANMDYTVWFDGTSAATPHVSAVAALILSVNPNLTQKQVAAIIEQTAQKIGSYSYITQSGRPNGAWNNEMGYGLLNAFAAVTAAAGCTTVNYFNQTVSTNTTVAGCAVVAQNVTVNSGAKLTLAGTQYVLINSNFEVSAGAEFEVTQ